MAAFRVGPLPEDALEASARFYAVVLPLIPPPTGEGDHPQGGGGAQATDPDPRRPDQRHVPLHHASHGPPPRSGEDLVIIFPPAPYDHRAWRIAAVQDLARATAPARVNGIVGDDEDAIAEALAYLESAPGITGQLLAVEAG